MAVTTSPGFKTQVMDKGIVYRTPSNSNMLLTGEEMLLLDSILRPCYS